MKALWKFGAAAAALAVACPAFAQAPAAADASIEDPAHGRLVYEAAFFSAFSPANALQMVERLPGFKLDVGDVNVRGFGGAAGNVVINGQRPSAKSDALDVILARIPASLVQRIEVAGGSVFGSDFAGKSQVANVVLVEKGGLAGIVEARIDRHYNGVVMPKGSASLLYTKGASTFEAAAKVIDFTQYEDGFDRLTDLSSETQIGFRQKVNRRPAYEPTLALGWAHEPDRKHAFHINAKVSTRPWNIDETSLVTRADGSQLDSLYTERHTTHNFELSGDIVRPLASGTIKLNAFSTYKHRVWTDTSRQSRDGDPLGGKTQTRDLIDVERVGRLHWTWPALTGWTVELGGEGAFNQLRSEIDLASLDAADQPTPIILPIANAVVTEYRGETFANFGHKLASNVHLDFGLTFEASRLTVTGDAQARRTLKFLKPNVSLDWVQGVWHAQVTVRRTVAQLDFNDFVSGAEVNTDRVNGGNADLVPQRAWEGLFSADRTLLGDGRVKIELGYNAITQVQDRVPVVSDQGDLFDAPGNLGDGTQWVARTNIDLPLEIVGVAGGRLSLFGAYTDTNVRDPNTLRDRPFSGSRQFDYSLSFRQDFDRFAWGVDLAGNSGATWYRLRETDTQQGVSPKVSAFAEYRPSSQLTVTFGVENLTDAVSKRWRDFYDPNRQIAPLPSSREYRQRNGHVLGYLSIKRSFG